MGRSRYRPIHGHPHFVTFSVVNWLPILSQPALAHILLDALRFLHAERRLIIHAYVLMENHCHLVVSAEDVSKEIGCLKSFTARQIIERLKQYRHSFWLRELKRLKASYKTDQKFQVWQEGFHPKAILTTEMLNQKIVYIHNNPVKRGYVDHPIDWRYSSARNYQSLPGLLKIEMLQY